MLGLCKVIPQEYSNIICRSVDVVLPVDAHGKESDILSDQLLAEIASQPSGAMIAYRENYRWASDFERLRDNGIAGGRARLRTGGVYLITGGLGGVGLVLAGYLARTVQAKLILVNRSALPERQSWNQWLAASGEQEAVRRKIREVQALEKHGAEVLLITADAANQEQMEAAIVEAEQRFGSLHGVIHAAGVVSGNSFGLIQQLTPLEFQQQFHSKVYGLYVLEKVLAGKALDFCLLTSSLSSILGGITFGAYAAANAFMDVFVQQHNQTSPVRWTSVNWDGWQLRGEIKTGGGAGAALAKLAITPAEGEETFQRILNNDGVSQVIVSTGELQARISEWIKPKSLRQRERPKVGDWTAHHPRPGLQTAYKAPRNETEQTIAIIWEDLLGIERVGVQDNFFELGGHSLLATQVISRLRDSFKIELPLRSSFEATTVEGLAECVAKASGTNLAPETPRILPCLVRVNSPLSFGQQRLWFLEQLEPGSAVYNIGLTFHFNGVLDTSALEKSFGEIIKRHEVLRTRFLHSEGEPVQAVFACDDFRLDIADLSVYPESERELEAKRRAEAEIQRPFDLSCGPLLRAALLRLAEEEHVLILTLHHIASDAWSLGILFRELTAFYSALSTGRPAVLPGLPVQYADYACWQRGWIKGKVLEEQLSYWKRQLKGAPPVLNLYPDHPRPAVQTSRGSWESLVFTASSCSSLQALGQEEGANAVHDTAGRVQGAALSLFG